MISEEKLVILIGKRIPVQEFVHTITRWTLNAFWTDFDQILTSSFKIKVTVQYDF
jgi:hypothetical protein